MTAVSAQLVKDLRTRTSAGFMECKNALTESGGDLDKAVEILRLKGASRANKKASREVKEGLVTSYLHSNGKIGVLLEMNCETDFVARTDDFKQLGTDICMQVAAMNPLYLSQEEVPAEVLESEKKIFSQQALESGKPEAIIPKIVEGKLSRYYQESCLLEQVFIKDDKKKVSQLVQDTIAKLGENIVISRFVRFQLGEKLSN